jgi:disulfide bond formation protein DsbB
MSAAAAARAIARDSEALALCVLGLCGSLVAAALFMEHVFAFVPCPLCLMQRVWFFIAGLVTAAGLLHNPRWGIYPLLAALAALVGGGFSIRQLWLQSLPADQVPACGPNINYMIEVFPAADVLRAMTQGTGDCAAVDWTFLGLSFAGWALVGFATVLLLCVAQLRACMRSPG